MNEYRPFAHERLKENVNLNAAQLVDLWGKHKKSDACVKAAAMEESCESKRQANPRDPGGNCKRPMEVQRDDGGAR